MVCACARCPVLYCLAVLPCSLKIRRDLIPPDLLRINLEIAQHLLHRRRAILLDFVQELLQDLLSGESPLLSESRGLSGHGGVDSNAFRLLQLRNLQLLRSQGACQLFDWGLHGWNGRTRW